MMTHTRHAHESHGSHTWNFFRAGGFDQVKLTSGADLMALDQLDQKLWVALACPVHGLEFDSRTLELIDTDHDGRIRAPDIIAATKWAGTMLKNPDDLVRPSDSLKLSEINDATPAGKALLASARQILVNLNKNDAADPVITLTDTLDTKQIFAQTRFNGDGIVPADASDDPTTQAAITDIMKALGSETDRSGKPGITQAKLEQFLAFAKQYVEWHALSEADTKVLALGAVTGAASAAVEAVRPKVEDYYNRVSLAEFDPRAMNALNLAEAEILTASAKDLTVSNEEIGSLPLAYIEHGRPLPLAQGLNPTWAGRITELQTAAILPVFGERTSLTKIEWNDMVGRLEPFRQWLAAKPTTPVETLGLPRLKELLEPAIATAITSLIAQDKALEQEALLIGDVEKLVRFHRDLFHLLNNFVSFREFYSRKKAIFQAGTLYLDQRACDLCIRVEDPARHALLAHLSSTYLAYCDLKRQATGETMTIAAAFTGGDSDNLMVGRNGLFYDRDGRDWDATITKIVENPISIRQAFWSPYKRTIRWIEDQIAKRAAAADAAATSTLQSTATSAGTVVTTPGAAGQPIQKPKFDIGVVAALGVAVGGITAALGSVLNAITGKTYGLPLAIIGVIVIISGPSMIIAWLKLRQRNLGPILDANGWAINAKAKINLPFGHALTAIPKLPPHSHRDLRDPFHQKTGRRNLIIVLAIIAAILFFIINMFGGVLSTIMLVESLFSRSSHTTVTVQTDVRPATTSTAPAPK